MAIIAYIFTIFADAPTKTIQGIGSILPWLSLFAAIPISILGHIEEKNNWKIWAYIYTLVTLLYIIGVLALGGKILHLIPHIFCCICMIFAVRNIERGKI